jgi:Ca2+-binding EF-hand superfamily protein
MNRISLFAAFAAFGLASSASIAFAQLDTLPDRPIKRSEVVAVLNRQFAEMDSNHDGFISPAEFEAYRARQASGALPGDLGAFAHVGAHWFEKNDVNGDGRISRAEAAARPLKMFDMVDMNHDGVIGPEERKMASLMMSLRGK